MIRSMKSDTLYQNVHWLFEESRMLTEKDILQILNKHQRSIGNEHDIYFNVVDEDDYGLVAKEIIDLVNDQLKLEKL